MFTGIRLQNFRSYNDDSFELSDGVNIIVGPNASGKTNLLEAVMVACNGKSYRVKDTELLQYEKPWARIDAYSDNIGSRTVKLISENQDAVKKEFIIDDQTVKRLLLNKTIPIVLFEPNHLQLLHGSPDMRREYIDNLLTQMVTGYESLRKQYKRALQQRNYLLKHMQPNHDQLFVWNLRLSDIGGQIALHRNELVARIDEKLTDIYQHLSKSKAVVQVSYTSTCGTDQYSSVMLKKLEQYQDIDIRRGFTGYGPHRDDITMVLNGHNAQDTASRGETRTLLLALKILELRFLEDARNMRPILLLDDVFSELDGSRRKALTEFTNTYQTFITTTDADVVTKNFAADVNIIAINQQA